MWRPIASLTSKSVCSVLFIMPVPSLARPFNVWYCFTTGKMFCQRLWIPEPSWNTQRMPPYLQDEPLFSVLCKYWSLILENITHCIPAILVVHCGIPSYYYCLLQQTITAVSCRQMAPIPNAALCTFAGIRLQPGHQSELCHVGAQTKQCFMYVQTTVEHLPPLFSCFSFLSSSRSRTVSAKTKQCRGMVSLHQM